MTVERSVQTKTASDRRIRGLWGMENQWKTSGKLQKPIDPMQIERVAEVSRTFEIRKVHRKSRFWISWRSSFHVKVIFTGAPGVDANLEWNPSGGESHNGFTPWIDHVWLTNASDVSLWNPNGFDHQLIPDLLVGEEKIHRFDLSNRETLSILIIPVLPTKPPWSFLVKLQLTVPPEMRINQ